MKGMLLLKPEVVIIFILDFFFQNDRDLVGCNGITANTRVQGKKNIQFAISTLI